MEYFDSIQSVGNFFEVNRVDLEINMMEMDGIDFGNPKAHPNLPPGPPPLPGIGNMLKVSKYILRRSFKQFQDTYGPIFTVYFGSKPTVMLCGYDAVKEALVDNKDAFSGRGRMPVHEYILKGYGIIVSNGECWKQMRRFSLTTLRNFGMGKRRIEERIQEEAQFLVEEFRKTEGKFFDPTFLFAAATSNIICSIMCGKRFDYKDERFLFLLKTISECLRFMSSGWGFAFYYFQGIMVRIPGPHQKGLQHLTNLKAFVLEKVEESLRTLDPDSTRHFIDCFLVKMQEEQQNPDTEFHHENLIATSMNLFFAGTETTSTTLRYGFLILLKYPEIQDVFPLLTTVLKDPEQFHEPEVFSPDRFLDDKGAVKKHAAFMPFSAGGEIIRSRYKIIASLTCDGHKVVQTEPVMKLHNRAFLCKNKWGHDLCYDTSHSQVCNL
ncbi:cytochrome P450 2B11-like [Engystomops pustulosus]|uniref:cytochrome P450 2B11-like n=1 Tax=Engystomops pustulosus TaxID=76066 RepID=UPI003AFB5A92